MRVLFIGISGMLLVSLAGCESIGLSGKRIDYRAGAVQVPSLEVPPDLTAPGSDGRYKVPQGDADTVATFSDYTKGNAAQSRRSSAVLPEVKGVRMERNEAQRWLVVEDKPENVWPVIKAFWHENGLTIRSEDQAAGVMETEWAENRARIPEDGLRKLLGKVIDSFYSSGERDQYRTRLERGRDGMSTEIYITHRGMEEVLDGSKTNFTWQLRPKDPEMEAIMLQRLMARFSGSPVQAAAAAAANGKAGDAPVLSGVAKLLEMSDGNGVVVINHAFDRSWRLAGLAIERARSVLDDNDTHQGTYFLRPEKAEKDWTDKLMFWKGSNPIKRYRVVVKDKGAACEMFVTDQNGAHDDTSNKMIGSIYKNINRAEEKREGAGRG